MGRKPWVAPRVILPTPGLMRQDSGLAATVEPSIGFVPMHPPALFLDYDKREVSPVFDPPANEIRFILPPSNSLALWVQTIGRAMRPRPRHKSKSRGWRKHQRRIKAGKRRC